MSMRQRIVPGGCTPDPVMVSLLAVLRGLRRMLGEIRAGFHWRKDK